MAEILENEIKDKLTLNKLIKKGPSCYIGDGGINLFIKKNKTLNAQIILEGELESLKQIESTKTIRVPKQYFVINDYDKEHNSAIVLEYLNLRNLDAETSRTLGLDLANLHDYNNKCIRFSEKSAKWLGRAAPSDKPLLDNLKRRNEEADKEEEEENHYCKHQLRLDDKHTTEKWSKRTNDDGKYPERFLPELNTEPVHDFGFNISTACGILPQVNEWTSNWVEFYARYRLEKPINLILSEHGDRELIEKWSHLQLKVDKFFTDYDKNERIVPALLHGDLWSGNVGQISDDLASEVESKAAHSPVIYDPSSFYGHNEYEFGIARMFGGFQKSFEEAYFNIMPKKKFFEKRNKLYQLFHHLNHWNHFGYGYRASSLKILSDLNELVVK